MRRQFISMTWTPGVPQNDARLLIKEVQAVFDLLRPHFGVPGQFDPLPSVRVFGAWSIPNMPPKAVYSDIEWFTANTLNDAQDAVLASRYLDIVELEPWQASHPHFDLTMTHLPITDDRHDDPTQDVLGVSRRGQCALLSVHPLASVTHLSTRRPALAMLYAHYIGMMFDAPNPHRAHGLMQVNGDCYCDHRCAMRHIANVDEAVEWGHELMNADITYCKHCQQDIVAQIVGYHYGLN